ncbi:MAG TPA: hypothetical protein EYP31_02210 [Roseibacterium sp.]|nr:hypothetical protein [Roseicyclus sp.]HID67087.1 hypothetical protein [Roseibacterium sp.]
MDKRIDPDLFARLMKLSSSTRTDLLEYLGQTRLAPEEAMRLSMGDTANVNDVYVRKTGE